MLKRVTTTAKEVVFLSNARSRSGATGSERARDALTAAGVLVTDFALSTHASEFESRVRSAVAEARPWIAIGGGDGTQRLAAGLIAGSRSTQVVVPLGTGNALARDLELPTSLPEFATVVAGGVSRQVDLGMANGLPCVNVASIGLTALIVKHLPKGLKGPLGRLVYLPAVIRSLKEMRPFRLKVTCEGEGYEGDALQFVACPGRTHAGPFRATRLSENDDGLLSMYALDNTDGRGMARFALGLLTGRHTLLGEVWTTEAPSAVVETRRPKKVVVDGETIATTPLNLAVQSRTWSVLVPAPAQD